MPGAVQKWVRRKEELGRGAHGVVYLEVQEGTAEKRAVKVITKTHVFTRVRWESEIASLELLGERHPEHFLKYLGLLAENENTISIGMEYAPYGHLGDYIHESELAVDPRLAQSIVRQLVDGLICLHDLHIAHRDLRPANIFITKRNPITVKIGDFGVSKRIENNNTFLNTLCGHNSYIAPEVEEDSHKGYTDACDMWSLGCICHELITKSVPFPVTLDRTRYRLGLIAFPENFLQESGASHAVTEFIKGLIRVDPEKRMTAGQARTHPWLTDYRRYSSLDNTPGAMRVHGEGRIAVTLRHTLRARTESL